MGKRGPQPKGPYGYKSATLSTNITPELRAALDEAASQSGSSLSQEIERRLRWSFEDDDDKAARFGSRQNYAIVRLIAVVIEAQRDLTLRVDDPQRHWTNDPFLFGKVKTAVNAVLDAIQPPDEPPPPSRGPILDMLRETAWLQANQSVAMMFSALQDAPPPRAAVGQQSKSEVMMRRLKEDLGPLVDRPQIRRITATPPQDAVEAETQEGSQSEPPYDGRDLEWSPTTGFTRASTKARRSRKAKQS